ncbi:hypothetical protein D3C75_1198150 [compost metagenome]
MKLVKQLWTHWLELCQSRTFILVLWIVYTVLYCSPTAASTLVGFLKTKCWWTVFWAKALIVPNLANAWLWLQFNALLPSNA